MSEGAPGRVGAVVDRFDAAEVRFLDAFAVVPDAALRYRPAGDDYALSGLVEHVTAILHGYAHVLGVLATMAPGPDAEVARVPDAGSGQDVRLVGEGFGPEDREAAVRRLCDAHDALASRFRALAPAALDARHPLIYGDAPDAFPTAPADVMGWVTDHYEEHIPHIASLVERWRAESGTD